MDIHKLLNLKGNAPSKIDEAVYELIAHELSSNQVKQGLWTKALADSEWNELKAKSIYVKMRHSQLIDEIRESSQKKYNPAISDARQDAFEYGLTNEEIDYLQVPIKAIRYLEKYKKSKEQVLDAISKKKINAVMKNEMLWVTDKSI
jgi:hypothetical protein